MSILIKGGFGRAIVLMGSVRREKMTVKTSPFVCCVYSYHPIHWVNYCLFKILWGRILSSNDVQQSAEKMSKNTMYRPTPIIEDYRPHLLVASRQKSEKCME